MAPVIPGPGPAPDPATTPAGQWQNRINWLVTIIVALVTLYLAVLEAKRPSETLVPTPSPAAAAAMAPNPSQDAGIAPSSPADLPGVQAPAPVPENAPDVAPEAPTPAGGEVGMSTVSMVLGILSTGIGLGCSGAQQQAWAGWGVSVTDCLLTGCHLTDQVVSGLRTGGWADIGYDSLGCLTGCIARTGLQAVVTTAIGAGGTADRGSPMPAFRVRLVPASD